MAGEMMTSLGEQLKLARRAKNKSLEDISNDTKIRKSYLEALEEGNYDAFPSQVYVRGFLCAYAKCVGLDAKAILGQYDKLMMFNMLMSRDPSKEASETVTQKRGKRRIIRKRAAMLFVAFLFIILCLVALLWLRNT